MMMMKEDYQYNHLHRMQNERIGGRECSELGQGRLFHPRPLELVRVFLLEVHDEDKTMQELSSSCLVA